MRGVSKTLMDGIIAHNISKYETENACNYSGVFSPEYGNKGKGNRGWCKAAEIGNEWRNIFCPVEKFCPEFIFEETFFGKHNALIINPKKQRKNEDEINIKGKNGEAEPNEVVTQVKRMTNR